MGEKKFMEKRCFEWFETWKIAIVVVIKLEAPNKQSLKLLRRDLKILGRYVVTYLHSRYLNNQIFNEIEIM